LLHAETGYTESVLEAGLGDHSFRKGEPVHLSLSHENILLYDKATEKLLENCHATLT
jgi:hypothetical protein